MNDMQLLKGVIKQIAGFALVGLGALCLLGIIARFTEPNSRQPLFVAFLDFLALALLPILLGIVLLRRKMESARQDNCPKCGDIANTPAGVLIRSHKPWLWLVGGWWLAALWGASRKRQVRCTQCDALYFSATSASRTARAFLWAFCLECIIGLVRAFFT